MLIYKTLLGLTQPYLRCQLQPSPSTYNTCSASHIMLKVPKANIFLGRSSFQFAAASDWNKLKKTLKLDRFISMSSFKDSIMDILTDSCGCFVLCIVVSTFLTFVLLTLPNNVCTMILCCYHVVMLCFYHAVLSCFAVMLS